MPLRDNGSSVSAEFALNASETFLQNGPIHIVASIRVDEYCAALKLPLKSVILGQNTFGNIRHNSRQQLQLAAMAEYKTPQPFCKHFPSVRQPTVMIVSLTDFDMW